MRHFDTRPDLPTTTQERLDKETQAIAMATDQVAVAVKIYERARGTRWFKPVVDALRTLSGPGERCMLCSGSEASQVEHYRPKAVFPLDTMCWENYLWSCGVCNQKKSSRFPPDTEPGGRMLNPLDDDVWSFLFIDQFGNLCARWRSDLDDLDPRAVKTIEILGLDRDALQTSRQERLDDLIRRVEDSLLLYHQGKLLQEELCARFETWCKQPFQPDVASYFLRGPGRTEAPFAEFCEISRC